MSDQLDIAERYYRDEIKAYTPPTEEQIQIFNANCRAAPFFTESAPDLMEDTKPATTLFWKVVNPFLASQGIIWTPQYQNEGTCVGQAAKNAADDSMAMGAALDGLEWLGRASVAGTYTGGRVEIANQPGGWQGSNCVWSANALVKVGILFLKTLNLPEDSRAEDEALAIKWTKSRDGIPANYETEAGTHHFAQATRAKSTMELAVAITNRCTAIQGSNLIATGQRDSQGISPLRKSGGHAQEYCGLWVFDSGEMLFAQKNSWGPNWTKGPSGLGDLPTGVVWLTAQDTQRQIDQGDCIILSGPEGFKKKDPIDWQML